MLDRPMPADIEAEKCVLGSLLRDGAVTGDVAEILTGGDFYREAHQSIYAACLACYDGAVIDVVLLREQLQRDGKLESVGGAAYLADLMVAVPSAANAGHYARIVRQKALLRGLIRAGSNIVRDAYERPDADALVEEAEQAIFALADKRTQSALEHVGPLAKEVYDRACEPGGDGITGLATGWLELDNIMCGLQAADVVILAARPSVGKTAMAVNIVCHAALNGVASAFFSLEQSKHELVSRMLVWHSRIDGHRMRGQTLDYGEMSRLTAAAAAFQEVDIWADDTPGQTVTAIRSRARRAKLQHGIGLVVIDYIQLMESRGQQNRQEEVSAISRRLKALAKELQVPVLALSQLNRLSQHRDDPRPRMSELRESGAIEQDADAILLLHRDGAYPHLKDKAGYDYKPVVAEVNVAKQRNGPTGTIELAFRAHCMRFETLSFREGE